MTTYLYPIPQITDFVGLFQYAQTVAPFAELVTIAFFVVAFLSLKRYDTLRALPPSLFIATFVAGIFYLLGMLADYWLYAGIVSLGVSVVALFLRSDFGG